MYLPHSSQGRRGSGVISSPQAVLSFRSRKKYLQKGVENEEL